MYTDIVYELLLQALTSLPYLLVIYIIDGLPDILVALVRHEVLVEILAVKLLPLCCCPCWEVNAIGNIANVILLRIVAVPDWSEHLLRNPSVELRHTINLLAGVASECRHAETLRMIIWVLTAHADKLVPRDTQLSRIATHVLAEETLVKIVVTSWYWSVNSIK